MVSNYTLWMLIKPSHLIVYASVLGIAAWTRSAGRWFRVAAVMLVVCLGLLPVGALLMRPLEGRFPAPSMISDVDGVIVLAGAELPELTEFFGEPQLSSHADRLTTFLLLAYQHAAARLVHAGGGTDVDYSQSDTARSLILGAGVEPSRVVFESRSRNTCESARLTQELIMPSPAERWLLVTSAFHMPRAVACFRAIDWEMIPYPTDFTRGEDLFSFNLVGNLYDVDLAMHEWIGLLYYRLRGFTEEFFPGPRN